MRFLCVTWLAIASAMGASSADAAFVTIDNFEPDARPAGSSATDVTFSAPGTATFINGSELVYTNLASLLAGVPAMPDTTVRLTGVNKTGAGGVTAIVAANNAPIGDTFFIPSGAITNGFLEFSLFGLSPNNLTDLKMTFFIDSGVTLTADSLQVMAVPEPTTIVLIGVVALGGGAARLRKRRRSPNA